MPEGPEIRRAADAVADAIAGSRARRVFFAFDSLKRFERKLTGRQVLSVTPRGKAMLTSFESGLHVYSHNQLYGKWMVSPAGSMPSTRRSLRFAVHNDRFSALLYSASEIDVLDDDGLESHPYLSRLGPDILAPDVSPSRIVRRLESKSFSARSLGALLLDQSFLAGLGNYLRSEILFDAGVHPSRSPRDLAEDERKALARSARKIARRSYRTKGITNEPEVVERLKARGKKRSSYRFAVFARAGRRCHRCEGKIAKLDVSGRRLYLCPRCQPPS